LFIISSIWNIFIALDALGEYKIFLSSIGNIMMYKDL
jgi:hypothetical protein